MKIYGQSIAADSLAEIKIDIERLPSNTLIDMAVHVYRGPEEGPTLLITSALHGDEVNGTETIRRMARNGILKPTRGTVITVPIVNVYGFLHQSRTLPDGKDLNRSFPGSRRGSLAGRLAHVLMKEIVPHCDCIVDLHTGGASRTNYPQVRCDFERSESLALAKAFGAPLLIHSTEIKGSFRKAASKAGKPILVYEGGESLRFDSLAIQHAELGICRLMAHLGMRTGEVEESESRIIVEKKWLRAGTAGVFFPFVEAGEQVFEGQTLAHVGDPFGHEVVEVLAPFDGHVVGLNNHPVVHAGDALIHLGKVEDSKLSAEENHQY